jgi:phosphoribosylaminoimidazolecarboxamide formyltransferase/IMP cyclohydrolase
LNEAGVDVVTVDQVTDPRRSWPVKTLHPKIHGGILARGDRDDADLEDNGIERFDLVVCNLYPFRETAADPSASEMDIIDKIDIGGPAMIRAAAKNHHRVGVVVSPGQYDDSHRNRVRWSRRRLRRRPQPRPLPHRRL